MAQDPSNQNFATTHITATHNTHTHRRTHTKHNGNAHTHTHTHTHTARRAATDKEPTKEKTEKTRTADTQSPTGFDGSYLSWLFAGRRILQNLLAWLCPRCVFLSLPLFWNFALFFGSLTQLWVFEAFPLLSSCLSSCLVCPRCVSVVVCSVQLFIRVCLVVSLFGLLQHDLAVNFLSMGLCDFSFEFFNMFFHRFFFFMSLVSNVSEHVRVSVHGCFLVCIISNDCLCIRSLLWASVWMFSCHFAFFGSFQPFSDFEWNLLRIIFHALCFVYALSQVTIFVFFHNVLCLFGMRLLGVATSCFRESVRSSSSSVIVSVTRSVSGLLLWDLSHPFSSFPMLFSSPSRWGWLSDLARSFVFFCRDSTEFCSPFSLLSKYFLLLLVWPLSPALNFSPVFLIRFFLNFFSSLSLLWSWSSVMLLLPFALLHSCVFFNPLGVVALL